MADAKTSRFAGLSTDELERRRGELAAVLCGMAAGPEQDAFYRDEFFPFELELIRRAVPKNQPVLDLLFVTVGGQAYAPALAVAASPARRYVFLVTDGERGTEAIADEVVGWIGLRASEFEIERIGDGWEMAKTYRAIRDAWQRAGGEGLRVGVDLTGGFKPMSAAGASAAAMLSGCECYYIQSDDMSPAVRHKWRASRMALESPVKVFAEIDRRRLSGLLEQGHFGSASQLASQIAGETGADSDRQLAKVASALERIDRLDCGEAAEEIGEVIEWGRLRLRQRDADYEASLLYRAAARLEAIREGATRVANFCGMAGSSSVGEEGWAARELTAFASDECLDFLALLWTASVRRRGQGSLDFAAQFSYRLLEGCLQRRLVKQFDTPPCRVDLDQVSQASGVPIEKLLKQLCDLTRSKKAGMGRSSVAWVDNLHDGGKANPRTCGLVQIGLILTAVGDRSLVSVPLADGAVEPPALDIRSAQSMVDARNQSALNHGFRRMDEKSTDELMLSADRVFRRLVELEASDNGAALLESLKRRHTLTL